MTTSTCPDRRPSDTLGRMPVIDGAPSTLVRDDGGPQRPRAAAHAEDARPCEADRLLQRVAERLRSAGADLPDAQLVQLADEVVADVARTVLAWAEEPLPAAARRPRA